MSIYSMLETFFTNQAQISHTRPSMLWSGNHGLLRYFPLLINTITQKVITLKMLPQSKGGKPEKKPEPDKQILPPLRRGEKQTEEGR